MKITSWSHYISLVQAFAWADFKLRFHGSTFGILWSVIKPLIVFGVIYTVFVFFITVKTPHYATSLLLAVILWNFFAEATTFSIVSIEEKSPLLKKIFFPRTIVVVSAMMTAFISLFFNTIVFFVLICFSDIQVTWYAFMLVAYLFPYALFTLGFGFTLSALFAKFKDVRMIWEMFLQLGPWITPIVYTVSAIPSQYQSIVLLNPIARVIEYSRSAFIFGRVDDLQGIGVLYLVSFAVFACGYYIFSIRQIKFAEEL